MQENTSDQPERVKRPRPDDKTIATQLRNPSGDLGVKVSEKMNETNRFITELTYDLMELKPDFQVLEIGFGNGRLLPPLIRRLPQGKVYGVDSSIDMVRLAFDAVREEEMSDMVELTQATVSTLPYADALFDRVCTINTLYFWPDPTNDIREVRRVLKPGGRVFLAIRSREIMQANPIFQYDFTLYDAVDVEQLLRSAGFEEIGSVRRMEPTGNFDSVVVFGTKY